MLNIDSKKTVIDTEEKIEDMKCLNEETKKEKNARLKEELDQVVKDNDMSLAEVIATYNYHNKEGKDYLRVMRTAGEPKFIIRHCENGEWVKGLGDYSKVPYNLPNLIKAKENNKSVVFIVSGEKDADTINNVDSRFLATTAMTNSPKKWEYDFNKYISKKTKVIILQDDSEYGEKFAQKTKATLKYCCRSCIYEIKDLKEIFDINDNTVTDITGIKERLTGEEFVDLLETIEESALSRR